MLKRAKLSFIPNNGYSYLKDRVDYVLESNGGSGAVREMIEIIIKQEGLYKDFLNLWEAN